MGTTCHGSASGSSGWEKFTTCATSMKGGSLSSCTAGCAPTLAMLQLSQSPVVTLSKGNFGTKSNVLSTSTTAPDPLCEGAGFGPFTGPSNSRRGCDVSSQLMATPPRASNGVDPCGDPTQR